MGLELGMREWMLLAGVALIVVIFLDAIRRTIKQRAENERLTRAKKSVRQEPHADFDWLKELPNGGARVIYRTDDENEEGTVSGQDAMGEEADIIASADDMNVTNEHPGASDTPANQEDAALDQNSPKVVESRQKAQDAGSAPTSADSAPSGKTVDWLETLDTEEPSIEEAQSLIEDAPPEHVLLIHLKADEHKPFQGDTLLQLLLACDLRFGDLGFFHRHEQSGGRGPIQFSVANLLKPGVFDIDSMSTLQTEGVVFFMRVPGPKDILTAYEAMLETARAVVQHLGGTLLDHSHSVLTKQAIEHDKTLLREYARKQLLQKRS